MKKFLTLIAATMVIGFISSCSKEESSVEGANAQSTTEFINQELNAYKNEEFVDLKAVRENLMIFDKTLSEADRNGMTNSDKIGGLFVENANNAGLNVYATSEVETIDLNRPGNIPTDLINALTGLVETANAKNIDEYLSNLDRYYAQIKGSNLKSVEKMAILGSVITLKVIAKVVRYFKPNLRGGNPDVKWRKQLRCAFKSLTAGLAGSLQACTEGASIVGGIGSLAGAQGKFIGSLVGCTVGAVIKGITTIVKTAQTCVKEEGL